MMGGIYNWPKSVWGNNYLLSLIFLFWDIDIPHVIEWAIEKEKLYKGENEACESPFIWLFEYFILSDGIEHFSEIKAGSKYVFDEKMLRIFRLRGRSIVHQ